MSFLKRLYCNEGSPRLFRRSEYVFPCSAFTKKVNIANRNLGCIFRSFTYMVKEMFLHLFKSLVRPHLEYGSVIFYPTLTKDQIMLENVQRRATRLVKALHLEPSVY